MPIKSSIPVNPMKTEFGTGVFIQKMTRKDFYLYEQPGQFSSIKEAHRDEYHLFFLQEKGTTTIEIDFKQHVIKPLSVIFIHQHQVHRILDVKNAIVSIWAISNENLNSGYLKLLSDLTPAEPLTLQQETFSVISEAASLCLKLSERKEEKLYPSLFTGSCATLTGLVIAQYLVHSKPLDKLSRFELVTRAFKLALEQHFIKDKRPAGYASKLNISVPYLNECVKNTTGFPVSYHIQQRIILEAKRLLYHSNKSVKEIAAELGYEDYAYFSRLFNKITGMSALTFRNKNRD